MAGWKATGPNTKIYSYTLVLSADATATELPGDFMYKGTYLLPVKYIASLDDTWTFTLQDSNGIDFLNGNGAVTDGTTGGHISPNDRWPITETLYYTLTGRGSGTITLTINVAAEAF